MAIAPSNRKTYLILFGMLAVLILCVVVGGIASAGNGSASKRFQVRESVFGIPAYRSATWERDKDDAVYPERTNRPATVVTYDRFDKLTLATLTIRWAGGPLEISTNWRGDRKRPSVPVDFVRVGVGAYGPVHRVQFLADNTPIECYTADPSSNVFFLMTEDALKVASANSVAVRAGGMDLDWTEAQKADFRDFVARLRPE